MSPQNKGDIMQINVLFFATIRDLVGQKRLTVELDETTPIKFLIVPVVLN